MNKRVVVTGLGVVSSLGIGIEAFYNSIREGKAGVSTITRFDIDDYPVKIAGEIKDFDPHEFIDKKEAKRMDKYIQYAVSASKLAVEDSQLDLDTVDKERMGVVLGSGIGGIETLEKQHKRMIDRGPTKVSPFLVPMMITNMAAGNVSIALGAKGINETIVTACASSTNAIGDSFKAIQRGDADIVVTGGTEAPITPLSIAGFSAMKALSTRNDEPERASRPFDKERDGFVIAEGSAILILEEYEHALKRGAKIYGEILGYGMTSDAYHITRPREGGEGIYRSMKLALKDAKIDSKDIDYINAHGTSTEYNDKYETSAIKNLFKDSLDTLKVSSSKSMTGHLLGAAGAIEMCVCALAVKNDYIAPTINYENKDEECDLDYVPNVGIDREVNYAISNSLAFGGHNASLIIGKYKGK